MFTQKLKSVGICTVKGVQMMTKKKLCAIKGLSEAKVDKIREAVMKVGSGGYGCKMLMRVVFMALSGFSYRNFVTALQASINRQAVFRLATGSSELDAILGGGIESMSITEAFGEFRSGKTQISHTLCVTTQMANGATGYGGGKVVFIDTENTFRPDRLRPIAARFNVDEESVLDNVLVARNGFIIGSQKSASLAPVSLVPVLY